MSSAKFTLPVIEGNAFLSPLTKEEQQHLSEQSHLVSYSKNRAIYQPGDTAPKVFLLTKGGVKITIQADKKDIIKHIVRPGILFGEAFLTGDTRRRDFALAMEDHTEVLEMNLTVLHALLSKNFAFAQALLFFLGEKLRQTESQLERVILKDSKSRIVDYLKQMGAEQGKRVGLETLVKHNMTHQDIADLTGTSRQMVTAVLNQLKKENVLYFNRKKILFRNLNDFTPES
jgi:CRP-like cAMP-binding protein